MFLEIADIIHHFDTVKDLSVEDGAVAIAFLYVINH